MPGSAQWAAVTGGEGRAAPALVFAGRLEVRGEIAQAVPREPQVLLLPLAMCDVAELPDVNDPIALERHREMLLLEDPAVFQPQLGDWYLFTAAVADPAAGLRHSQLR